MKNSLEDFRVIYSEGYVYALEEFEKIINNISDLNFTKPIKKRLIEEINKLKEKKNEK